jgi:CRISPR system Cascade subunit CasB
VIEAFIGHLRTRERAAFAELRRSLSFDPGEYPPAFRHVEPFAANLSYPWQRTAYYLVAGLYAQVERPLERTETEGDAPPVTSSRRNLGHAIKALYVGRDQTPSIEARFIALLDADEEQLKNRLQQMMSLLRADGVPVPWVSLLEDLLRWNHPERFVQRDWARAFYQHTTATPTEPTSPDSPEEVNA